MRHRVDNHKLGKNTSQRMSVYKSIVIGLLRDEKVVTTETKAKRARVFAEHMITLGKKGTLHCRRQALSFIGDEKVIDKVFGELGPRYASRPGGYTRVTKIGPRLGDAAPMARIDLVS